MSAVAFTAAHAVADSNNRETFSTCGQANECVSALWKEGLPRYPLQIGCRDAAATHCGHVGTAAAELVLLSRKLEARAPLPPLLEEAPNANTDRMVSMSFPEARVGAACDVLAACIEAAVTVQEGERVRHCPRVPAAAQSPCLHSSIPAGRQPASTAYSGRQDPGQGPV
jgi:hypothetical protein